MGNVEQNLNSTPSLDLNEIIFGLNIFNLFNKTPEPRPVAYIREIIQYKVATT